MYIKLLRKITFVINLFFITPMRSSPSEWTFAQLRTFERGRFCICSLPLGDAVQNDSINTLLYLGTAYTGLVIYCPFRALILVKIQTYQVRQPLQNLSLRTSKQKFNDLQNLNASVAIPHLKYNHRNCLRILLFNLGFLRFAINSN